MPDRLHPVNDPFGLGTTGRPARPEPLAAASWARGAAAITAAIGVAGLAGWILDLPFLRTTAGTSADINPASALIFVLGGLALAALSAPDRFDQRRRIARVAALAIVVMALLRLAELKLGWPLSADQFLVPSGYPSMPDESPVRVSAGMAILYCLAGAGLLLAPGPGATQRIVARTLGIFVASIAAVAILGYLAKLSEGGKSAPAPAPVGTVVALMLLTAGTALVTGPEEEPAGSEAIQALRTRVTVTIRIAIGVLILISALSLWSSGRSQQAATHRQEALTARALLADLVLTVEDAETSQRGFLLTDDSAYARRYAAARDSVAAKLLRITERPDAEPTQGALDDSLRVAVERKMSELALTVTLHSEGRADSALRVVRSGVGEEHMLAIRKTAAAVTAGHDRSVAQWDARVQADYRMSLLANLLGGILAILFLTLAGIAISRDLGRRAVTEGALRASEARWAKVIELIPSMVYLKDPDTLRFTRLNRAGSQLLGYAESEIVGKDARDLLTEEHAQRSFAIDRAVLASQDVFDLPAENVPTKSGKVVTLHMKRVAVRAEDGRPLFLLGIAEDITDRLAAEAGIREARDAAERANHAKSDFLAKMSHELRTPLNSIIGFSEILADETPGPLTVRQRRYVGNVLESGRNLLQLINDILDLSKVEAGHMDLVTTTFAIEPALEQIRAIVEAMADRKRLTVRVEVEPGLPPVTADRGKFAQIMYNLVGNALKFTPEDGSVTIRARRLEPSQGASASGWLEVSVIDTGIGIATEHLERIFGEFEQIPSAGQSAQEGTGLGLALTRRLVELHGGRVTVESTLGAGSTFRFTLPLDRVTAETVRPAADPATPEGNAAPLVLIIDNEPQARDLLGHYLTEAGYRVASTSKGSEAVALAEQLRPAAITLDILMPDRDGLHTLAELKQSPTTKDIPVVVVSITDRRELGFSLGAADWLVKPVQATALLAALERTIGTEPSAGRTVLVVDDEPAAVEYLTDLMSRQGFTVVSAMTGWTGVELAVTRRPNLILLDLMLPDLNGFDVVRTLRAHPDAGRIPILIVTGKDLTAAERASLRRTVQGIVQKDGREELLAELHRISQLVV